MSKSDRKKIMSGVRRIVLKLGTRMISSGPYTLDTEALARLAVDIADIRKKNYEALIVSSGAIAAGTLTVKTLDDAGAAITLDTASNDADTIDLRARNAADSADAAGEITFMDSDDVSIDKVSTTSPATVTAGGSILVSGSISAGGLTTTLTADDDIKINANITDTTAISAHSGTDGSGNINFGAAGVTLDAPIVTLRAGDGLG